MPAPMPAVSSDVPSTGGTLVTLDGRALPLRRADLRVRARGGVARTVLEQRFINPHAEPLRVTYQLPLPADGAVGGFRFRIDDREIVGEVDRRRRARERFEEALLHGHTAALVEQDRSSLFSQEVGNIPPGATVVVELEIDQPLAWRPDAGRGHGGWEYRFPTVVAPRFLGRPGRVEDASRVAVGVADRPRSIEMSLELRIADPRAESGVPSSPSHALSLTHEPEASIVTLAEPGAGLDRDVVVRWPVAAPEVGLHLDTACPQPGRATAGDAFGLITLVPPRRPTAAVPRDLIVLIDTSGSMHGEPIDQAKRIATALVDGLGPRDQLELIEFSTAPRSFAREAKPATDEHRREARRWIGALRAGGGTQMREGIVAALANLRPEAQRQVVLITDGQIGFEHEIIAEIAERLPVGSRVHTVGVGSAVNRSLTQAAARAGRGLEVVIGIGEDPEPCVVALLARTEAPLVVDLTLEGDALLEHAPAYLPDLFAGAPVRIAARLRPEGGTLRVRGRTAEGSWDAEATASACTPGQGNPGVIALFGRESVEDLELRKAAGAEAGTIDPQIEQLGVRFQIATRLTSWIAISREADVDPGQATRRETVPQQLPYGMSVEGLGLRASGGPMGSGGMGQLAVGGAPPSDSAVFMRMEAPPPPPRTSRPLSKARRGRSFFQRIKGAFTGKPTRVEPREPSLDAEFGAMEAKAEASKGGVTPLSGPAAVPGRIVLDRDGRLVVEVLVPFALRWDRPATVELCAPDGTRHTVSLDTGTTAAASLEPGVQLRLCFRVPDGVPTPITLKLRVDGHPLIIDPLS